MGVNPNPDPTNWVIEKAYEFGEHTMVRVVYPNCQNYEGNKIMLYKAPLTKIESQETLDPHFLETEGLSPIARFEPTDDGWEYGIYLMNVLER